jgi:aspartyl-tRNA(Asn)/glutamyl-tRNA(Gln) amidotransferase subunit A
MLDAMKGPDARDWFSLPEDGITYRDRVREGSLKGKRVALSPTLGYHEPTPAVRAAVERAAKVFADQGAIVETADPFTESPFPIFQALAGGAMWAMLRGIPEAKHALMDPGLVALCERGAGVTQEQYVDAVGKRVALGIALNKFFERYDLILSPTMPTVAAWAEPRGDGSPDPTNIGDWLTYTWAFNLTKNPSASIPCGFDSGLPIGLMVTGRLYDDLGVLQACRAYEAAAGASWPSAALSARLDAIAGTADAAVGAKILPAVGMS